MFLFQPHSHCLGLDPTIILEDDSSVKTYLIPEITISHSQIPGCKALQKQNLITWLLWIEFLNCSLVYNTSFKFPWTLWKALYYLPLPTHLMPFPVMVPHFPFKVHVIPEEVMLSRMPFPLWICPFSSKCNPHFCCEIPAKVFSSKSTYLNTAIRGEYRWKEPNRCPH